MKTLFLTCALFTTFDILTFINVFAQQKKANNVQDLTQNFENTTIQNGLINVGGVSAPIYNVTFQGVVTVQSVLNNAEINIFNNSLNNNVVLKNGTIDLSNVLKEAKILNLNQIIIGVLSDQDKITFVTQKAKLMK